MKEYELNPEVCGVKQVNVMLTFVSYEDHFADRGVGWVWRQRPVLEACKVIKLKLMWPIYRSNSEVDLGHEVEVKSTEYGY